MKALSIFSFFLLFCTSLFSKSITGAYKPLANCHVYACVDDDYITNTPLYIAETIADAEGKFTLNLKPLNGVNKVWIKTSQYITYMYVIYGFDYEVKLSLPASSNITENKQFLKLKVLNEEQLFVNKQMAIADSLFDDFYSTYYNSRILPRSLKRAADAFKTKLYQLVNNNVDYVEMYCHYSFATLDTAAGMKQTYMYEQYANNELYTENPEVYYNFIKQNYKGYFENTIAKPCFGDASAIINEEYNCISILQKLTACDSIIKNDSLRELLFVCGLQSAYYKREYKKPSIEMMLRYMALNSKFSSIKKIAKNIIAKISALNVGALAPEFALPNAQNDSIKLSSQKGKLVYLCFTNYSNVDWQTHLPILERLQLLYDKRFQIITITLGNDMKQMNALLKQKKFSNEVLNGFDNFFLKSDYQIDALPKYIMIDADGDIIKTTNCSPIDGVEEIIKQALMAK